MQTVCVMGATGAPHCGPCACDCALGHPTYGAHGIGSATSDDAVRIGGGVRADTRRVGGATEATPPKNGASTGIERTVGAGRRTRGVATIGMLVVEKAGTDAADIAGIERCRTSGGGGMLRGENIVGAAAGGSSGVPMGDEAATLVVPRPKPIGGLMG